MIRGDFAAAPARGPIVSAVGIVLLAECIENSLAFQGFRGSGTVYGKPKNVKNNVRRSQDGKEGSKFGNYRVGPQLGFGGFEDRGRHCIEEYLALIDMFWSSLDCMNCEKSVF